MGLGHDQDSLVVGFNNVRGRPVFTFISFAKKTVRWISFLGQINFAISLYKIQLCRFPVSQKTDVPVLKVTVSALTFEQNCYNELISEGYWDHMQTGMC